MKGKDRDGKTKISLWNLSTINSFEGNVREGGEDKRETLQFRARRSRSARVYPRATKRPQSLLLLLLPREIRRRNCERGSRLLLIAAKINPDRLFPHVSLSLFQIQVYGYNAELYHNMSEAQHKSQGLVAISLMVQVSKGEIFKFG